MAKPFLAIGPWRSWESCTKAEGAAVLATAFESNQWISHKPAAVCTPSVLPSRSCATYSLPTKAVDALMTSYISEHHVPGLSIAVVQNGRVVMTEGYGLADIENNVKASAETVYRIASLSKSITAVGVMKLEEAGKIDLDAPIQKYCPAFPQKPWPITTRELLAHQSGIRDYRNDEETINTRHYTSIHEALTQFAGDPLDFEPGDKDALHQLWLHCAGLRDGRRERNKLTMAICMMPFFGPAQMTATRLDDVFAIIPHRARGYRFLPLASCRMPCLWISATSLRAAESIQPLTTWATSLLRFTRQSWLPVRHWSKCLLRQRRATAKLRFTVLVFLVDPSAAING